MMGGIAAAGIPTAANAIGVGLDGLIVQLADAVFEGDRGSASFVSGVGLSAAGLAMIAAIIWTDIDDFLGILIGGLGAGMLVLGAQAFNEARQ